MYPKIYYLVLVFALGPILQAQGSDPLVIVRVTSEAGYDDTPESLAELQQTLRTARIREVAASKSDTPNTIIDRTLDFGISNRPEAYQLIEEAILELNKPSFKVNAEQGTVLMPDLGPWAWENYNPQKAANYVPKIAYWTSEQSTRETTTGEIMFVGTPEIIDNGRKASQSIAIEYTVSASTARSWKADSTFEGEVLNFPMSATLAQPMANMTAGPTRILTPAAASEIRSTLAAATRTSIAVIADTGWPSAEAYSYSLEKLTTILNVVRKEYLKLGPVTIPATAFKKPSNSHCQQIELALEEFEQLDTPADRVNTIYVPLTREQDSSSLLREFLVIHYLHGLMKRAPSKIKPSVDDENHARGIANAIITQLPPTWPAGQVRVRTDKAVLEAYLHVLNLYSSFKDVDATFFFNESWTAPHEEYYLSFPSPIRGAVVAAVGNDGQDFIKGKYDFAQRCVLHRDTIAVMNIDGNGVVDTSAFMDETEIPDALAVGIDGRISDNVGGTSFSAPRVAWLFAAAETVRKQRFNMDKWGIDAMKLLVQLRGISGGLKSLRIDPLAFLRLAAQ